MIDKKYIGYLLPPVLWEVEKGRIAFFAKVIGLTTRSTPMRLRPRPKAIAASLPHPPSSSVPWATRARR